MIGSQQRDEWLLPWMRMNIMPPNGAGVPSLIRSTGADRRRYGGFVSVDNGAAYQIHNAIRSLLCTEILVPQGGGMTADRVSPSRRNRASGEYLVRVGMRLVARRFAAEQRDQLNRRCF